MDKKEKKIIFDLLDDIKINLNIDLKSDDKDKKLKKDKKNEDEIEIDIEKKELSSVEKLELEIANLMNEISKLEEAKLMAIADNQNTVRRFQNETMLIKKYGGEKLAIELLPAIDMFRTVLKSSPDNPEIKNYLMGFEMIISQIDQALSNSGIQIIEVKSGDEFNPELHTAIEQIETEEFESGKITSVVSNGYKLHDRVIKHAAVKVAK
ncbi:nucleotide exchange factor GrpE [Spiroplasma taiwanense]|uniref:Protein GrpE n=1 Tax=Spiroplasma taiwanense CT-1 TaxID=1276220 RepID=S5LZ67_9MOLU|nr:nucleotide exchange factor GrpE [Spiroplasma taiwanense]AGR40997.1 molecular chaperone GrpE (heat shock protein) [Spiroplasma taiwanense CT-1]